MDFVAAALRSADSPSGAAVPLPLSPLAPVAEGGSPAPEAAPAEPLLAVAALGVLDMDMEDAFTSFLPAEEAAAAGMPPLEATPSPAASPRPAAPHARSTPPHVMQVRPLATAAWPFRV
jgi:hypothetical protein